VTTEPLTRLVHDLSRTLAAGDPAALPDADLLARFRRDRDPAAFEAIVRRHGPRVLGACRKVLADAADAEDAFQATFLVLMRRPHAVRRAGALGPWLFGVAHRVALQARAARRRRERIEARAPVRNAHAPDLSWREACAILHEELDRLPDRFRLPLLLCYLDGLSRDEAAQRLGRSLGAVKKALEAGRELLRKRLTRRGVTLSAGLLAALAESVDAQPPADLTASLVAGTVRPAAATLAKSVRTGARLRLIGVGLAAGVLAVGVALGFPDGPKGEPPPKETPAKPASPKEAPADDGPKGERIAFAGRVVDPDGKPVNGAQVFLVNHHEMPEDLPALKPLATSAADGRFHFAIDRPLPNFDFRRTLVAAADGLGLGLLPVKERGTIDAEVRLFPDLAVRGRILDLEGKPVAGAMIRVTDVGGLPTADLSEWLKEAEGPGLKLALEWIFDKLPQRVPLRFRAIPALAPAVTDKDGRFTLSGIGRDRLAALSVTRPGIATSLAIVVTKPGPAGQFKLLAGGETLRHPFYRLPFDHVVTPEQPLEGRVTDRDSGEPIAGVRVWTMSVRLGDLRAVTDKDGGFRLGGLPPGSFQFDVQPGPDTPYHLRSLFAGKRDNIQPARLDVRLPRAPWVTGTVIDERTRQPVAGARVFYKAAKGNLRAADYFDKGRSVDVQARTGPDGSFRLAGVPGKGWLFVHRETPGVSAAERPVQGDTDQREPPPEVETSDQSGAGMSPGMYQALMAIDIDPKAAKEYTITVDPGVNIPVTLTDPEVKPVPGAIALGVEAPWWRWSKPLPDKLEVPAFNPDRPRALFFYHPDRDLGIHFQPKKGDAGPWTIRLQPTATVTGTLVLPDGKPYPNADLTLCFTYPGRSGPTWLPDHSKDARFKTDADGKFRFTKVIGDVDYEFWYPVFQDKYNTTTTLPFRARPGETKDLGTVKTDPPRP
jgi:RNA polymerase sigma factor (sigma-70 family)